MNDETDKGVQLPPPQVKPRFRCRVCDRGIGSAAGLSNHMRAEHPEEYKIGERHIPIDARDSIASAAETELEAMRSAFGVLRALDEPSRRRALRWLCESLLPEGR